MKSWSDCVEKNRKNNKNKNSRKNFYTILLCVFVAFGIFQLVRNIDYFNIKNITVAGNNKLKKEEVIQLSKLQKGQNIFKVNRVKVKNRIRKSSYVEEVKITRKLPDTVNIIIVEKPEIYQIVSSEKTYIILDKDGNILKVSNNPSKDVTVINGVKFETKIDKTAPGKNILEYIDSKRLAKFLTTNEELKLGKDFKEINLNKGQIDIVLKNNKIVKFGTLKDSDYKLKLLKEILDRTTNEKISFEKILMDRGQKPIIVTDGLVITEEG